MRKNIQESYIIINLIIAGIIVLIVLYSGIFSAERNNHPIPSACVKEPCPSTGLSRSFSEIVRFRFESAERYNPNGIIVFSFFFLQFWLRIIFSILFIRNEAKRKRIIIVDSVFSLLFFVFAFRNFIILLF